MPSMISRTHRGFHRIGIVLAGPVLLAAVRLARAREVIEAVDLQRDEALTAMV